MPVWVASFLFAVGGSVWLYNLLMKKTGSNTQACIILTAMAFLFMFAVFWSVLDTVAKMAQ